MRLGVIFQGGGAKLVSLLAAAEVLESLEDENIEVVAVAGTSAGALAAFALASRTDATQFRVKARAAGERVLPLVAKEMTSRYSMLWRAIRGYPLVSESFLEDFVKDFTAGCETYLKEASRSLYVCSSDLSNGDMIVYSSKNQNDRCVESLSDSAAIPLFFRAQKSRRQFVDGGICANLPDDSIFSREDIDAVLAISFDEEDFHPPDSVITFFGALMSTSVEYSMSKAADQIQTAGGIVVRLPRMLDTLDFKKAIEVLRDDKEFATHRDIARFRINEGIALLREREVPEPAKLVRELPRILSTDDPLYCALRRLHPFQCERSEMRVLGLSLGTSDTVSNGLRDELVHIVSYRPLEENDGGRNSFLAYVRVGILINIPIDQIAMMGIDIRDKDNNIITAKSMIQIQNEIDTQSGSEVRQSYYVHIFDEEVPAERAPVTVTQTIYISDLLKDLRQYGTDCIRTFCRRRDAPEQYFFVAVPASFGTIRLSDLHNNEHRLHESEKLRNIEKSHEHWSFGRTLENSEIGDVCADIRKRYADFSVSGWYVSKAQEDTWMGCLIEKIP